MREKDTSEIIMSFSKIVKEEIVSKNIFKKEVIFMSDCIFCKIINGDIPCYKIYENDYVLAFLDINPDSDGHTLIIPKKHFTDLDDIDLETLKHILIFSISSYSTK